MGATVFTLLTGLPVHEAETAGEMLIAAATRPARSLARVLNQAPFQLVALVDRALSYERENRFPDAHTFRAELQKIRASVTQDIAPVPDKLSPDRPIIPATVHGKELPAHLLGGALDTPDDDDKERIETFDPSSVAGLDRTNLRTVGFNYFIKGDDLRLSLNYLIGNPPAAPKHQDRLIGRVQVIF